MKLDTWSGMRSLTHSATFKPPLTRATFFSHCRLALPVYRAAPTPLVPLVRGILSLGDIAKEAGYGELDIVSRRSTVLSSGVKAMMGGPLCCGTDSITWKIVTRLVPLFGVVLAMDDLVEVNTEKTSKEQCEFNFVAGWVY